MRAVKIIRKDKLDKVELERLFIEIDTLKSLDHPAILKIFEVFEDSKRVYIVSELVTGGELFDQIIKKSQFSEGEAANVIQQVLEATQFCHSNNIVHRDLKPENLLLEEKDSTNIKVIDFGTSQEFDPDSPMNQTFGTAYYIAPEVLKQKYDEKCDIWSIGVIMYILLTGRPPFDGQSDNQIIKKVEKGKFPTRIPEYQSLSADAKDLITKLLDMSPAKRLSASEALQHEWFKTHEANTSQLEEPIQNALSNLKAFQAGQVLQQAALTFIVSQLATNEEVKDLKKAFQKLDLNKDGKLSREELLAGYSENYGELAEEYVDKIMQAADADGNGEIEYSEWIVATVDKNVLLTDEKLKIAFDLFDKDGGGSISATEIKETLGIGKAISQHIWDEIVAEVDIDGDGDIDFDEFAKMMKKLMGPSSSTDFDDDLKNLEQPGDVDVPSD